MEYSLVSNVAMMWYLEKHLREMICFFIYLAEAVWCSIGGFLWKTEESEKEEKWTVLTF